jgi:hypothetical protein
MMWEVAQTERNITGLAYANFSIHTYPSIRKPLMEHLKTQSWVTIGNAECSMTGRRKFLQQLREHKFTFCPRGNGIDTHRLWETLYMGGIPIVENAIALEEFNDLPICWVERMIDVTPEFLESEYERITSVTSWNWDKLRFSYWKKRIEQLEEEANQ